jgi:hypothetical protein
MGSLMLASALVYAGLITALCGAVSLIIPIARLGIRTRRRAVLVLAVSLGVVAVGFALPAKEVHASDMRNELDQFMPVYQFHEYHSTVVPAPREQVYRAIKSVTANDIFLFRTLTWIRRGGAQSSESILNASGSTPLLDVATKTSFLLLAEEPGREIVVGTLVAAPRGWRPSHAPTPAEFRAAHAPGFALAAMNFALEDAGGGSTALTSETRIYATDPSTLRRFACYWRVIYPGSALIRRMWLRAIAHKSQAK